MRPGSTSPRVARRRKIAAEYLAAHPFATGDQLWHFLRKRGYEIGKRTADYDLQAVLKHGPEEVHASAKVFTRLRAALLRAAEQAHSEGDITALVRVAERLDRMLHLDALTAEGKEHAASMSRQMWMDAVASLSDSDRKS